MLSCSYPTFCLIITQGRGHNPPKGFNQTRLDQVINYRPISLLITISKVLEKIVYIHVYKFSQDNKILYNSQYGFRSKHSCEQAILELIGNVIQAKDKGMHTAALFLDLSKAFDTLNHEVLLKKLERYGIRGICNDWFGDYLSNRSLKAKIQTADHEIIRSDNFDILMAPCKVAALGHYYLQFSRTISTYSPPSVRSSYLQMIQPSSIVARTCTFSNTLLSTTCLF